jgi:hypothetical protein
MDEDTDSLPPARAGYDRELANVLRALAIVYKRLAPRWGKPWEGELNKPLDIHFSAQLGACELLAAEHGSKHEPGTRVGLCPRCSTAHNHTPP